MRAIRRRLRIRERWNRLSLRQQATIWSTLLLAATAGLLVLAINVLASATGPDGTDARIVPIMTPAAGAVLATPASVEAIVRQANSDTVARVRTLSIVGLLVAITGGAAGTYWMTGLILRRVGQYAAITRLVDQHALHTRLPGGRADELGALAAEINSMMARLEDAFTHQDRFSDQLLHQLVNRVTSIKASVDSMSLHGLDAGEFTSLVRNTSVLFDAISELSNIHDLTSLQSFHRVQLVSVVQDIVSAHHDEAEERCISLVTTGISSEHWVFANRDAVKIALANLVDNAISYGRPGGEVAISATERSGSVSITVQDNGVGIAREDITRVFNVAFRGQNAIERRPQGTGLGLAITSYLVSSQGGAIEIQSLEGRGTDATIFLPTATDLASRGSEIGLPRSPFGEPTECAEGQNEP